MMGRRSDHGASTFYQGPPSCERSFRPEIPYPLRIQSGGDFLSKKTQALPDQTECTLPIEDLNLNLARKDKALRTSAGHMRLLREELEKCHQELHGLKMEIDPRRLKAFESLSALLLTIIGKAVSKENHPKLFKMIPEVLAAVDLVVNDAGGDLNVSSKFREFQDDISEILSSDSKINEITCLGHLRCQINGSEFLFEAQKDILSRLSTLSLPADLKYVALSTGEMSWANMKDWWTKSPLSLRWLTLATEKRKWLAYVDLYTKSPEDLRWAAVLQNDPRWLHYHDVWNHLDLTAKLKALKFKDFSFLRTADFKSSSRFELIDCSVSEEAYLIPLELRDTYPKSCCITNILNRCTNCALHCRAAREGGSSLGLLDLEELRLIAARVDKALMLERNLRESASTEQLKSQMDLESIWESKLKEKAEEVEKLRREVIDLQKSNLLLKSSENNVLQQLESLRVESGVHSTQNAALIGQLKQVETRLGETLQRNGELEEKLISSAKSLVELQAGATEKGSAVEQQVLELEKRLKAASVKAEETQKKWESEAKEHNALRVDHDALCKERDALKRTLAVNEEEWGRRYNEIEKKLLAANKGAVSGAKVQLETEELKSENQRLKSENQKLQHLESENERARALLDEREAVLRKVEDENSQRKLEIDRLENSNKAEISLLRSQLQRAQETTRTLQNKLTQVDALPPESSPVEAKISIKPPPKKPIPQPPKKKVPSSSSSANLMERVKANVNFPLEKKPTMDDIGTIAATASDQSMTPMKEQPEEEEDDD